MAPPDESLKTLDGWLILLAIIGLIGLGLLPGVFLQPALYAAQGFLNLAR